MRRGHCIAGLVALVLVAAGCGAPPATQEVATQRPRPVVRPALPGVSHRAQQPSLPASPVRPAVRPAAIDPAVGPRVPIPGSNPAVAAGPAVPGARPSAPDTAANVYGATISGAISPALADVKPLVYVPNSLANTVSVIDPATLEVIDRFPVGVEPHHVTPSWDLTKLYVNNTQSNTLTVIDPRSGKPTATIPVVDPYNLYFTIDGTKAVVVAERFERLDFRDPRTWELIKSVPIPYSGADHMDFSADGTYLIVSTEFSGKAVKVDIGKMEVTGVAEVGSLPVDVKVSPDGSVFFVANQGRHGVSVVDPGTMKETEFIPTGRGAHGIYFSRDTKTMYVSNRLEGSITTIDVATHKVLATWKVGGSPDMIQLNPDGTQLWVSGRYNANVLVVDTTTGRLIKAIPTGAGAHGVSFFPAPGRFNVGHNGVYR